MGIEDNDRDDDLFDDDLDDDLDDDDDIDFVDHGDMGNSNEDEDEEDEDDSDDDEDNSDEDDSDEDDEDNSDEEDPQPKRRNKVSARERIAELTKKTREAERKLLEAELRAQAAENQAPRDTPTDPEPVKPDPSKFDYGEYDPAYIEAMADYKAEVKFRERMKDVDTSRAESTAASQNEHYRKRLQDTMAAGIKKYTDFKEILDTTSFDQGLARLVLDFDMSVDIAYYLGNNIGVLREITALSESDRARRIGRLEGRFSAASAERKKRNTKPVKPTKRSQRVKGKGSEKRYGPNDQDAFDKAFYEQ